MENEKRLIDANSLLGELDKFSNPMPNKSGYDFLCGVATVITEIEDAPTVDAVEVVRCCDCISCKVILDNVGAGHWHCKKRYGLPDVDPTDFCSYGERRNDEQK